MLDFVLSLLAGTPLPSLRNGDGEVRVFWVVVAIAVPFLAVSALVLVALSLAGGR